MASSWVIGLVSLVVAILLVSVASAEEQVSNTISFAGTWTDNRRFGQNLYICTPTATTFYGVYSEYGFFIGHLENSRSVEGRWYEACIGTCCRGDFKLDLSHDGNSFTGSWTCSENPKRAFTWIETRKSDARTQAPNDYQCGALTTTAGQNLTHSWVQPNFSGEWDICQTASSSGNKYQSSYLVTYVAGASPSGYETGHFYQGGRVNQGYFDEGGSSSGTSLTLLLKNNEMLNMRWVTGGRNKTVNRDNYSDSSKHKYLVWQRDVTVEPTATECVRNQFLSTAPQTVNSANSVSVIPMLTVLLSIVIAVILF